MATNKNFEVKNGLSVGGTERISSAGAFSGSLASGVTATTQSAADNSTKIATTAYTDAAITAVIGGAPGTLDTLNELAAAINDDASYATTLTTALATKLPLAGGSLTGALNTTGRVNLTDDNSISESYVQLGITNTVSSAGLFLHANSGSGKKYEIQSTADGKLIVYDRTSGAYRLELLATGDVTVPGKVLVNTDIRLGSEGVRLSSDGNGEFGIGYGQTATNSRFTVYNNTAVAFRVLPNGNVGIGTSAPAAKLDITGTNTAIAFTFGNTVPNNPLHTNYYGGYSGIGMDQTTAGVRIAGNSGAAETCLDIGYYTSGVVSHANWNSSVMVKNNSRVGIGTSSPTHLLQISGGASDGRMSFTNNARGNGQADGMWVGVDATQSFLLSRGAYPLTFYTNATERLRIDSSGNVGIGTTNSISRLSIGNSSADGVIDYTKGLTFVDTLTSTSNAWVHAAIVTTGSSGFNGNLIFATDGTGTQNNDTSGLTERMRISSNGNVVIGTPTDTGYTFSVKGAMALLGPSGISTSSVDFKNSSNTKYWGIAADQNQWYLTDADFSHYAYLSQNFTAWSFGSDRRLKENIEDISYGLDAVKAMQPRSFRFKSTGVETIGFIAQELAKVIPEAVSGEEIEYLESDSPQEKAGKSMGVSKETLIPVLVKAIQEQQTLIEALTSRITALEG